MNNVLLAAMDGTKILGAADTAFVCIMGIGIVFIGLVAIVAICTIMSNLVRGLADDESAAQSAANASAEPIANRQEFIAAVSAAIAEDMGKDVSAIRIVDVKKI